MPRKSKIEPSAQVKDAENTVRDLKNWIFVFAKEYSLADEAIKMLHEKVDEVAKKVGAIECKPDPETKKAEDTLRDLKNWVATFTEEYSLADEAKDMLYAKIETLAKKIGAVVCR